MTSLVVSRETRKPCCYCVCSVLSFHFPTDSCARFFSLETSAIELKLWHNIQNGLNSGSITLFWNLTERHKNYS